MNYLRSNILVFSYQLSAIAIPNHLCKRFFYKPRRHRGHRERKAVRPRARLTRLGTLTKTEESFSRVYLGLLYQLLFID